LELIAGDNNKVINRYKNIITLLLLESRERERERGNGGEGGDPTVGGHLVVPCS
jgi:hypothetical protein